jgi:uncharacterized protein (DUF302 family)
MEIYLSKTLVNISFADAENLVVGKLKEQGFGVITEIDVQATLKNKIGAEFRPYKILGACNPQFAYDALSKNDKVGVMLPCNVCLQQSGKNDIEVFTINPLMAMEPFASADFAALGQEVYSKLTAVIDSL